MSRLSDLVNEAIILNTKSDGTLVPHDAVSAIKPALDDESRDILVTEALHERVSNAAKNSKSAILKMAKKRNMELPFNVDGAMALDIDGRYIKRTESLTQAEFKRAINIREKQIVDDSAKLAELRTAYHAVEPIWERHPDYTFGQCCSVLLRKDAA